MIERFARAEGKSIVIVPLPLLSPKLFSYWVGLITPVKPSISMPLIEEVTSEMICHDTRILDIIPVPLTPHVEAAARPGGTNRSRAGAPQLTRCPPA